jgi:Cd2+/Zn2+-exporting ATPase
VTGRGIRSTIDGAVVEVGRLLMFEERGAEVPAEVRNAVAELEMAGQSTVVVFRAPGTTAGTTTGSAAASGWLGVIGIADEPRPDVRQTLDRLRQTGIRRIVMLTGDNAGVGNAIGQAVGIDEVRAGLLPEDKVAAIKELAEQGPVAMVGDGVNDAPALAHATVGIAMGGAGTAAALETADVALMGDDLGRLPFAIGLSRQARAIIRQNLYLSLGVIALLIVATTTGIIGIGPAVVMHEGSTLVVIGNALRLLVYRGAADA